MRRFNGKAILSCIVILVLLLMSVPAGDSNSSFELVKKSPTNPQHTSAGDPPSSYSYTESFEGSWLPSGWSEHAYYGRTDWYRKSGGAKSGSRLACIRGDEWTASGILQSRDYDTEGASWVKFSCYFQDKYIDNGDLRVFFKNKGGSWTYICDLNVAAGSPDFNDWRYYEYTTSNSNYLHEHFNVRYFAKNIAGSELAGIDLHKIEFYNPVEKYAVCVGIDDPPKILSGDDDAYDWTSFLIGKSYSVTKRVNSQATETTVRNDVQSMADAADMNDIIVFTFSGHGILRADPLLVMSSGTYSDDELYNDLKDTKASRCFIFLDACESGGFTDNFAGKSKFLITTACDDGGAGFDLATVSDVGPPNYPVVAQNGAWTYFFLVQNLQVHPTYNLEDIFDDAVEDFDTWYTGSHWIKWGDLQWYYETWSWNYPSPPTNGPQEGNPEIEDGDGVDNFTL